MSLKLADHWLWDHWIADDGQRYHLFFLRASKALHDPDRRHFRAALGHALSPDAVNWTLMPDALVHADSPAFDDKAIWTGSTVVLPDGRLRVFYTGISNAELGQVQRIGWADSSDGVVFHRASAEPICADPRWYGTRGHMGATEEHWRDPFVFQHEGMWHMLITARARNTDRLHAGVVGHAVSADLDHWEVLPPLSEPSVFGQLEVCQSRNVEGRHLLIFSCGQDMQADPAPGGVWVAEGEGPLGPWDIGGARYVRPEHLYAGQLFQLREGAWRYTGFEDMVAGSFVGVAPDPIAWDDIELVSRRE